MRIPIFLVLVAAGLFPQAISCAEARPADATVERDAPAAAMLATTLALEIPYGDGPEALGFDPPGDGHEALGPNAIEVRDDGTILISDPVRRRIFAVRVDASGRPSITVAGPIDPRPVARRSGVPTETSTAMTSGEAGEIVFAEGGVERRVAVPAGGPMASLRLVGVDRLGRAFVVVERFVELGRTAVLREVIVIEPTGALVARADLPAAPLVHPLTELYLTPGGALYRLAAGAESVRIERLEVRP